jgi:V-type H+-transporting ATPase subunit H
MQNDNRRSMCDLAILIEAQIIEAYSYDKCKNIADHFFRLVNNLHENKKISVQAYVSTLAILVKTNELAQNFVHNHGFKMLTALLKKDCIEKAQVAYHVICTLWVLSYHEYARPEFCDYDLNVLEYVSKILDYFNQEKIVRIVLMLFNNLKHDDNCLEQLSLINANSVVNKLLKKPWVDEAIKEELKNLEEFFQQNYQEFSSFEKWAKQVERGHLAWSPVHTEKFW